MPNVYLDTNIYILGISELDKDCSHILREASRGHGPVICQSDYLFDEVIQWFKREKGKDYASGVRVFMISIPNRVFIHQYEWSVIADKWKPFVSHDDDLPHICSYFIGECEALITTNRRLTQSNVLDKVKFMSPEESVEMFHIPKE